MNENDDVTSTYGELKPKPTCASGTKEQPRITDNDIARLTAEIDQRALAVALDERYRYGKALGLVRKQLRRVRGEITHAIDPKKMLSMLCKIHEILEAVDEQHSAKEKP